VQLHGAGAEIELRGDQLAISPRCAARHAAAAPPAEICKELGLTSTHCWVLLYRARMGLRECLEKTWFRAK
jgi:hypothetical protein